MKISCCDETLNRLIVSFGTALKTVRLLDLVLNDVESHRLGQGSSSYAWREELPALTNGHDITLLHLKAGGAVSGDVAMSLLVTTPSRSRHTSTVCTS